MVAGRAQPWAARTHGIWGAWLQVILFYGCVTRLGGGRAGDIADYCCSRRAPSHVQRLERFSVKSDRRVSFRPWL